MVISSPTHIENNLLGYYPMLGFAGADVIADRIYTSAKLGMEKHLIDMFGDAGLEYEEPTSDSTNGQETGMDMGQPIASSAPVTTPQPMSSGGHGGSYGVGGMAQDDLHIRLLRGFLKPITKLVRVPMPTPAAPTMPAAPHVSTPQHPPSPAPAPQPAPTTDGGLVWAADAEAMLKKIPAFVRGKVRKNTEQYAHDNGHTTITAEVLRAAKEAIGG
jgi:light-independent protochlorophyllide reductase subunit B